MSVILSSRRLQSLPFTRSFIHSFVHLFIRSFIKSLIHSFNHLFIHFFIHSFIQFWADVLDKLLKHKEGTVTFISSFHLFYIPSVHSPHSSNSIFFQPISFSFFHLNHPLNHPFNNYDAFIF